MDKIKKEVITMKKNYFICMMFILCCVSGMNANPDSLRILQKYEGIFSSYRLDSGGMLSFHIFEGVGLRDSKIFGSPFFYGPGYGASITCVDIDGKEQPVQINDNYFVLPAGIVPVRFVLSADGYATRTVEVDFSGNRFFYSTVLLKDLSVLEEECKNTYSPYLLRMLAQCYEDGYLTQKDMVKADSLRKLANHLYADDLDRRVGIVYDGTTGKPLPSVKVTYWDEYNNVRIFTSNTQGEFPLCKSRSVTLSADGFLDRTITYEANSLPIPFITTLQKKGSDIKRMMKSDPERERFWKWQQALCYLEGYGVKKKTKKAMFLFMAFRWNAGTTIYLNKREGAPYIETGGSNKDVCERAAKLLSYEALENAYHDYSEVNASFKFWSGVLGNYGSLYTWNWMWKENTDIVTNHKCTFLVADYYLVESREVYIPLIDAGKLAYEYGNRHIAGGYEKAAVYFEEAKARLEKDRGYSLYGSLRGVCGGLAFYLSKLYRFGRGVPKDVVKADALLKEASEKGWNEANSLDDLLKALDESRNSKVSIK